MPSLREAPWQTLPRHRLKSAREAGLPMYFDRVRNRWVAIPKAEHPEFKKYIRKLANQLPIHEKLFSPDAGLGWRLLFLAGLPLIAPAIFLYGYLRALLTGEDI